MYCQACGAENTEDARFCNMCGSRFAQAGEAGGPIAAGAEPAGEPPAAGGPRNDPNATVLGVGKAEVAAAAPPTDAAPGAVAPPAAAAPGAPAPAARGAGLSGAQQSPFGGDSMLGVTLGGIGVQSAKKAWITVLAVAAFLVAAGALATWLAMRGSDDGGGHAEADDPFVLGTPLTEETDGVPDESVEGDPTPEDIDFITGGGATTMAGSSAGSTMRSTSRRATGSGSSSAGSTGGSTGSTTSMESAGGSTGSGGGSTMASTGGSSAGSGTGGSTAMEPTGGSTDSESGGSTTMESTGGSTGSGSGGSLPTDTESAPEERDLELELYGSRVRYVVRRYYAGRAQNCFDRATRNDPHVSGTVVIAMTIGADGEVGRTSVQRNTTGNETLGSCLSSQVASWRLPPPPGGSLDMTMPFSR